MLVESGLGSIRPVDDESRLKAMLSAADLIVTAHIDQPERPLVGVVRCLTDFLDLLPFGAGGFEVGAGIRHRAWTARRDAPPARPKVALTLASVPDAVGFYERAGMARVANLFWYKREQLTTTRPPRRRAAHFN